jgi:nucleotide-binding universal stress UspA family protein
VCLMFRSILVPLDGSLLSESALPAAGRIARASGGRLILATVISVPILSSTGEYDPVSSEQVDVEWRDAEDYLQRVTQLPLLADIDTRSTVDIGSAETALQEAIASSQCDLLVMTSHGRTGLARWALGSIASHLVRYADVPVLVFREQGPKLESPHPDMEHLFRVLVCLDSSEFAEAALAPAAQLALALGGGTERGTPPARQAGLHLVLVIPPSEGDRSSRPPALGLADAKEYLAAVADRMKQEYPALTLSWTVGVGADVAKAIVRVAESGEDVEGAGVFGGCDVVALSTHGRTGIARWTMGSVTERVLDSSNLPALVVRPVKPTGAPPSP